MAFLLHETLIETARAAPDRELLVHDKAGTYTADAFARQAAGLAVAFNEIGIGRDERIAVYLPKLPLTAFSCYAASMAGAVFVPVNPVLKAAQVVHILNDCAVRVLVTSGERLRQLVPLLDDCPALEHIVLADDLPEDVRTQRDVTPWTGADADPADSCRPRIDNDMAAILYTSGSTGRPKGVVISHRNIVTGAQSVAEYLEISGGDRLLAALPFSFDYGLNQLTASVLRGAACVLFDYLLPRDVVKAVARHRITGLAAVPPLWAQLAPLDWPREAAETLRYFTNSGGAMPEPVLAELRQKLPNAAPVLMYGLTEAFRSTYLPSTEVDRRKGSMGRAIPNAEIVVVNEAGEPAAPHEHGELVHRGALVALGYWNDPARTAERFKPAPGRESGLPFTEIAVWSGDTVYADEDGYLYFVGRSDAMIKTSGYRVSPEEIEEVIYGEACVEAAAAFGVPHDTLGQAVLLAVTPLDGQAVPVDRLIAAARRELPGFMVPLGIFVREAMPHNPNGKIDRRALSAEYAAHFTAKDDEAGQ